MKILFDVICMENAIELKSDEREKKSPRIYETMNKVSKRSSGWKVNANNNKKEEEEKKNRLSNITRITEKREKKLNLMLFSSLHIFHLWYANDILNTSMLVRQEHRAMYIAVLKCVRIGCIYCNLALFLQNENPIR